MLTSTLDNLKGMALSLVNRPGPGARVLLYHRVVSLDNDPQLLAVSPQRFDEQMRRLADEFHPLSLGDLADCIRKGDVPRNAVAVTFDDGYADNLTHALPILEAHRIPATIFVATGTIGSARGFYWDKLEDLFLTGRELPKTLSITLDGEACDWTFPKHHNSQTETHWNALTPAATQRQSAYLTLCDKLRPLDPDRQRLAVDELCAWANVPTDARATHRAMTADQLRELSASPMIQIGAHTIDHPILATLPIDEQRKQIDQSKATLEKITGNDVNSFSYPYGTRSSYTLDTVDLLADAGLTNACSNFPGAARRTTDLYQLPRILIRDGSPSRMFQEIRGAAA